MIYRLSEWLRLPLYILGLGLFFAAERYFPRSDYYLMFVIVAFALMVVGTLCTAFLAIEARNRDLPGEMRCWKMACLWQAGLMLSPIAYLVYRKALSGSVPQTPWEKVLLGLWLLIAVLGIASGIGIEMMRHGSGHGPFAEPKRVLLGWAGWLSVGMVTVFLVCLNYAGVKLNVVRDWSYFKTTVPGESSHKMIAALDKPMTISLFYPLTNEVRPSVAQYFDQLAGKAPNVKLEYFDKDLDPKRAEELRVSKNGQVVLSYDERRERIDIGSTTTSARSNLRKLDSLFQKAFLTLTSKRKVAYFTTGHGELSWRSSGDDPLHSIGAIEVILRSQNVSLRSFGANEGSYDKVPDDATMVVIVGPTQAFMKEEVEALKAYVQRGGKLAVFLDIEQKAVSPDLPVSQDRDPLKEWLTSLGLRYHAVPVANEQRFVTATRTEVDKWFLFTNNFSSHESVQNLSRNSDQVQALFFQTGYLEVMPQDKSRMRVIETIRSLDSSFADLNKNFVFDKDREVKKPYVLAAALEEPQGKGKGARLYVMADATVLSDVLIRNQGNQLAVMDAFKWLVGESNISGDVASEEDVKIQHSRSRELYAFHGTVFGAPFLLLVAGFFATRRKKSK